MTSAIILAGGLGTRLKVSVPNLPKPMAPINERPFLEHQMDYWINQGVNHFIISVGYRRADIINHFGKSYRKAIIEYAIEETPLGTGGGLLMAIQHIHNNQPVLVLNGDTFFEVNLNELKSFHQSKKSKFTFSLFRANEEKRYMSVDLNRNGIITSLKSSYNQPRCLANGGVYLLNPEVLKNAGFISGHKISLENEMLPLLIDQKILLYGFESSNRFIDIGIPEDYLRASSIITSKKIIQ